MKDSEFIELLNLYLDHEISEPDAARLEAEVQSNRARRQIYEQYCRMQKACKLLAAEFAGEPAEAPQRTVVAFGSAAGAARSRWTGWRLGGAFAAAAACVAVIFVVGNEPQSETGSAAASTRNASAPVAAVLAPDNPGGAVQAAPEGVDVDTSDLVPRRRESAPGRSNPESLRLETHRQTEMMVASALPQSADQFEWIRTLQVAPLGQPVSADSLRFDVRPVSLRPEGRTLGKAPAEADVEMTAFRFVK